MATRVCTKCKQEKGISEFNKNRQKKDGRRCTCRDCDTAYNREYRRTHREQGIIYSREHYKTHKKEKLEYAQKNKERVNGIKKRYIERHPERRLEQCRRYYQTHKDRYKAYCIKNKEELNKWRREYHQNNPQARIAHNLRTRICAVLSNKSRGSRLNTLVGCDMDYLKKHLEAQWTEGMSWQNYGRGTGLWSLDHIQPLYFYDLTKEDECRVAFHFSNMQPMWYPENSSKSNRYSGGYKK
jgi:hypothetical protein